MSTTYRLAANVHQFLPFCVQAAVTSFVLGMIVTANPLSMLDLGYTEYGQKLDHVVFGCAALGLTMSISSFCFLSFPIIISYAIIEREQFNVDAEELNKEYRWMMIMGILLNILSILCLFVSVGIRMYIINPYLLISVITSGVILIFACIVITYKLIKSFCEFCKVKDNTIYNIL